MRIELKARLIGDDLLGGFFVQAWPVRAIRDQRAVAVHHAHDPRAERNRFTCERIGIAEAVPPLVMPADQQLRLAARDRAARRLARPESDDARDRAALPKSAPTDAADIRVFITRSPTSCARVAKHDGGQIAAVQPAVFAEHFRQARHQHGMRLSVAFDPVGFLGEFEQLTAERLLGFAKDQTRSLYWYQRSSSSKSVLGFPVGRSLPRSAAHSPANQKFGAISSLARTGINPL